MQRPMHDACQNASKYTIIIIVISSSSSSIKGSQPASQPEKADFPAWCARCIHGGRRSALNKTSSAPSPNRFTHAGRGVARATEKERGERPKRSAACCTGLAGCLRFFRLNSEIWLRAAAGGFIGWPSPTSRTPHISSRLCYIRQPTRSNHSERTPSPRGTWPLAAMYQLHKRKGRWCTFCRRLIAIVQVICLDSWQHQRSAIHTRKKAAPPTPRSRMYPNSE